MENLEAKKNIEGSTEDGNIIKSSWIRYSDEHFSMPKLMAISLNMTFNDALGGFVTAQVWGRLGDNYYLLNHIRERMNFPEMLKKVESFVKVYCPAAILADTEKTDPIILDILTCKFPGVQLGDDIPSGSIARCHAMSFLFAEGKVYIPKPDNGKMRWAEGYTSSLLQFPTGTSNDEVDATTQALYYLFKHPPKESN